MIPKFLQKNTDQLLGYYGFDNVFHQIRRFSHNGIRNLLIVPVTQIGQADVWQLHRLRAMLNDVVLKFVSVHSS